MKLRITQTSEIHCRDLPVWQEPGGDVLILDRTTGLFYGLDAVGSRVWALIQTPLTVEAIRDLLAAELGVDPDHCERDLMRLLHQLAAAGLIQVVEGHA